MENKNLQPNPLQEELINIEQQILHLAQDSQDNSLDLILILRHLESIHRQIRDELLAKSLPDTRHHLYILLKHIEEIGGWPYIPRMRLSQLAQGLIDVENKTSSTPYRWNSPDNCHDNPDNNTVNTTDIGSNKEDKNQ